MRLTVMYKLANTTDPFTLLFFDLPARGIIAGGTAAAKGTYNLLKGSLGWLTAPRDVGIPLGGLVWNIGFPLAAAYPSEYISRKMTQPSSMRKYHPGYLED